MDDTCILWFGELEVTVGEVKDAVDEGAVVFYFLLSGESGEG